MAAVALMRGDVLSMCLWVFGFNIRMSGAREQARAVAVFLNSLDRTADARSPNDFNIALDPIKRTHQVTPEEAEGTGTMP